MADQEEATNNDSPVPPTTEGETEQEKLSTDDSTPATPKPTDQKKKIDIFLKPAGNTPIMKKKKWSVEPDKKISMITQFIRRYLKLDPSEQLFIYVNQAFAPAPDQIIENLYECFETDGKLVLHYCLTQAWG